MDIKGGVTIEYRNAISIFIVTGYRPVCMLVYMAVALCFSLVPEITIVIDTPMTDLSNKGNKVTCQGPRALGPWPTANRGPLHMQEKGDKNTVI